MENKYLTVGTDYIKEELFRPIIDDGIKPKGGLWLSEYEGDNFNKWVDFIILKKYLLFYKCKGIDPFVQPCSIVTLKDKANIVSLSDEKDLSYLFNNFCHKGDLSYEKLSKYYDGVFVNVSKFFRNNDDYSNDLVKAFGVNSLVLFNLDCVDYYQSGRVLIEPFDYEDRFYDAYYNIEYNKEKKRVLKRG